MESAKQHVRKNPKERKRERAGVSNSKGVFKNSACREKDACLQSGERAERTGKYKEKSMGGVIQKRPGSIKDSRKAQNSLRREIMSIQSFIWFSEFWLLLGLSRYGEMCERRPVIHHGNKSRKKQKSA
ncbi:MAG: hypothetical protein HFG29_10670 [Eubacterium sp.]|nr:hypothetical protein [Eubacterium sp.]